MLYYDWEWDMDEYVATQVGEERAKWESVVNEKDETIRKLQEELAKAKKN